MHVCVYNKRNVPNNRWVGSVQCKMIDWQLMASLYGEVGEMAVDGGFQGCCCGNRGTGGTARRAEDSFWGGEVGGLLKDSEHEWERLPASSPTVPLA